jgi:hypothetical protein
MSSLISKNLQVGSDPTATNNFTIFQPATPDGTLQIGNGNTGITSSLVTLTSAGNLGVGVTPSAWGSGRGFEVGAAGNGLWAGSGYLNLMQNTAFTSGAYRYVATGTAARFEAEGNVFKWFNAPSGTAGDAISFTQATTLDSTGGLRVGLTTNIFNAASSEKFSVRNSVLGCAASFQVTDTSGGYPILYISSTDSVNSGGQNTILFYRGGSLAGSIGTQISSTSYNTSSDYRLKNITGPITTSGAYIDSLNPVEGTWKIDGAPFVGLIAHEVQEASRTPVATGTKDGEMMQGMDYSSAEIISNLIAEVKSLRARVAQLEAK